MITAFRMMMRQKGTIMSRLLHNSGLSIPMRIGFYILVLSYLKLVKRKHVKGNQLSTSIFDFFLKESF